MLTGSQIQPYAVCGADIDVSVLPRLSPGDKILVEMNGVRLLPGHSQTPLAAEFPWEVESNEYPSKIVLRHTSHPDIPRLTLYYSYLQHRNMDHPAVFHQPNDQDIKGQGDQNVFIILQFVAFYLPADEISATFIPSFNESEMAETLCDRKVRKLVLQQIASTLQGFALTGWRAKTLNRLSLRSGVMKKELEGIKSGDPYIVKKLTVEKVLRLCKTLSYLPLWRRQEDPIQHDAVSEFQGK